MNSFNQKTYKGVQRTSAKGISELFPLCLKALKLAPRWNEYRVFLAWEKVTGLGKFTISKYLKGETLYITLSSSMLRNQTEFRKAMILKDLNKAIGEDDLIVMDSSGLRPRISRIVLK